MAMVALKEAAASSGYTLDQARKRLALLAPFLDGSVHRGPRGTILLTEEAVDLLRRIHDLEASGHTIREAVAMALAQNGPLWPKLDSVKTTAAGGETSDRPTLAQSRPTSVDPELLRILWVLVGVLSFCALAILVLGIAALTK